MMRLHLMLAGAALVALVTSAIATTASPARGSLHTTLPRALVGSFSTKIGKAAYPLLLPGRYTISLATDGALSLAEPGEPEHFQTGSGSR